MFTKKLKNNESSSHGSNNKLQNVANPCDVEKKHVSTSCDHLLDMPCSSQIDACSTSMSCKTNLLKENNELKNEVKKLSNKLERCYNSKVTFEHMLKTQRNYGDKCFKCHTWGHLTSMCSTKQLVKQLEEHQPKPQVEQEKTP